MRTHKHTAVELPPSSPWTEFLVSMMTRIAILLVIYEIHFELTHTPTFPQIYMHLKINRNVMST